MKKLTKKEIMQRLQEAEDNFFKKLKMKMEEISKDKKFLKKIDKEIKQKLGG